MEAKVSGKVVNIGVVEYNNKQYPFFELLQPGKNNQGSYIARISGDGETLEDEVEVLCRVTVNDKGGLKFKKVSSSPKSKY